MGQKADDSLGIPLCSTHHKEQHRIGWKRFIVDYRLNLATLLAGLNEKPRIVIGLAFPLYYQFVGLPVPRIYFITFRGECTGLTEVNRGWAKARELARQVVRETLVREITRLHQKRNAA
jgi:hypothetical protein